MENYMEYKISKVAARMKSDVVPHIFNCQQDKRVSVPRLSSEIRARKRKITEIISESEKQENKPKMFAQIPQASTSFAPSAQEQETVLSDSERVEASWKPKLHESKKSASDFCCQANPVHYRSKAVQTVVQSKRSMESVSTSPMKFSVPIQVKNIKKFLRFDSDSSVEKGQSPSAPVESSPNIDMWRPSSDSSDSSEEVEDKKNKQIQFRSMFIDILENKLRMYTGIPKENIGFVALLEKRCKLKKHFIYLTLYKIKSNESFGKIADLFGISITYASNIFQRSLVIISSFMNKLVFWPDPMNIKKNLPIQFRITFSNVQAIIDCLEIEIQKPSSAKQQALTWSDYKKCNTIKYLISSTPDGLINFISKGYGGRVSDVALFEECGFMDIVPKNAVIMADRGFKKIEKILYKKNCTLVRPPSVAAKEQMSKEDVLLTKRIASVRIHIERIIKRIRDFKMLSPHAVVNIDLVQKLDNIIIIACAIVNLQKPILKK